jgi:hypothetical protein
MSQNESCGGKPSGQAADLFRKAVAGCAIVKEDGHFVFARQTAHFTEEWIGGAKALKPRVELQMPHAKFLDTPSHLVHALLPHLGPGSPHGDKSIRNFRGDTRQEIVIGLAPVYPL